MSLDKLQREVAALLAPVRASQEKADETQRMTAEQFAAYADGQVKKAQAEEQGGKRELAKRRLTALHAEVTRLAKFEFKPSELPAVTVYKDPEQLETTEEERSITSGGNSTPAGNHWTAKSQALAKHLAEAIGELSNQPPFKNEGGQQPQQPQQPGQQQPAPTDPQQPQQPQNPPAGDPPPNGQPTPQEKRSFADHDRGVEWPRDLAKSIRPSARDKDADYDWGKDARG